MSAKTFNLAILVASFWVAGFKVVWGDNWTLTWSDEFEGPFGSAPDHCKWGFDVGNKLDGWGNMELQYYTSGRQNSGVDGNGNLVVTARKIPEEGRNLECHYGKCLYTSARLLTKDTFEQQYGRFEARIKLPKGTGLWPAFWMLGNNVDKVSWPRSGEIDVMEFRGSLTSTVAGTIHGPGYSAGQGVSAKYELTNGNSFADDFHVFAVEWTDRTITWKVDEKQYHQQIRDVGAMKGKRWVFDHPFFLLLNLAVGGHYDGRPDSKTVFPAAMHIDYVRAYRGP